jgi:putative methionine-R-sulfoxide reductase with GAF domain
MVLAARRPKPACSPIGIHGACGQSLVAARTLVVRDVAELGAGYIACDPRDRSELVVPCLDADGRAWGVFDVDSHDVANFDRRDADCCAALLVAAGLSARAPDLR